MTQHDLGKVLDNLFDGVCLIDPDHRITYWNESAAKLTGLSGPEMLGSDCRVTFFGRATGDAARFCDEHCPLTETDPFAEVRSVRMDFRHKAGHVVPIQARVFPLRDPFGRIAGAAAVLSDESLGEDVRKHLARLEELARLDPLTRLPNRRYVEEQVAARLAELNRFDRRFGLILMDIDHFENVNERYGRDVGDDVLRMVGRTLLLNSRPYDTVGRWEDDMFATVVVQVDRAGVTAAATRLAGLVAKSQLPGGAGTVGVAVSVGGTVVRRGDNVDSIAKRAAELLAEVKELGGGRVAT